MQSDIPVSSGTHRWIVRGIVLFALLLFSLLGYFVIYQHWLDSQCDVQFARAETLVKGGNAERGLIEYRALAGRVPGKPVGLRAAREIEWLEKYLAAARALRQKADSLLRDSEFEKAISLYQQVQQQYPLSRMAADSKEEEAVCRTLICKSTLALAAKAGGEKRWRDVLSLAQKMEEMDPGFTAGQDARRDAQSHVDEFETLMKRAQAAAGVGDWPAARLSCEKALLIMPADSAAYEGRVAALKNSPAPEGMVLILPGSFAVGSEGGDLGGNPLRTLNTPGFYMDAAEVTNAQYARFVASTGHAKPPQWGPRGPAPEQATLPVACVSWHDAAAYAAWAGKRMPTEVEWERTARGRTGRIYPWGDECTGAEAVFSRGPAPAGTATADRTDEGCLDLGGNLAEWVAFEKEPPPPENNVNPMTVPRPIRGASWAGVESGRPLRVAPERIADKQSNPENVILTDLPNVFLEIQSPVEEEFFFRGMTSDVAVFEIRKWFPEYGRVVSCSVLIKEGQAIAGSRPTPSGPPPSSPAVKVTLDSGCRLVRVLYADNKRPRVVYADRSGQEREMVISARPELGPPRGPDNAVPQRGPGSFNQVLRELMARPLSRTACASNRRAAPGNMLFCNVGFRCAKDLP